MLGVLGLYGCGVKNGLNLVAHHAWCNLTSANRSKEVFELLIVKVVCHGSKRACGTRRRDAKAAFAQVFSKNVAARSSIVVFGGSSKVAANL